jgi:hypothetical protein
MALSLGKYKWGATDSVPPASRAVTKRFAFVTLIGKRPMRLKAIPRRIEFLGNWQRLYRVALYQGLCLFSARTSVDQCGMAKDGFHCAYQI